MIQTTNTAHTNPTTTTTTTIITTANFTFAGSKTENYF